MNSGTGGRSGRNVGRDIFNSDGSNVEYTLRLSNNLWLLTVMVQNQSVICPPCYYLNNSGV